MTGTNTLMIRTILRLFELLEIAHVLLVSVGERIMKSGETLKNNDTGRNSHHPRTAWAAWCKSCPWCPHGIHMMLQTETGHDQFLEESGKKWNLYFWNQISKSRIGQGGNLSFGNRAQHRVLILGSSFGPRYWTRTKTFLWHVESGSCTWCRHMKNTRNVMPPCSKSLCGSTLLRTHERHVMPQN